MILELIDGMSLCGGSQLESFEASALLSILLAEKTIRIQEFFACRLSLLFEFTLAVVLESDRSTEEKTRSLCVVR